MGNSKSSKKKPDKEDPPHVGASFTDKRDPTAGTPSDTVSGVPEKKNSVQKSNKTVEPDVDESGGAEILDDGVEKQNALKQAEEQRKKEEAEAEEEAANLMEAFKKFDEDNSGELGQWEFTQAWFFLGLKGEEDEINEAFASVDTSKNGKIDPNEFMKAIKSERFAELNLSGVLSKLGVEERRMSEALEAEQKKKDEEERIKQEAARKKQEEAARLAEEDEEKRKQDEAERLAEEKRIETERLAEEKRIEAERLAEEKRIEAERQKREAEEAARQEEERKRREEKERKQQEEAARLAEDKRQQEEAARSAEERAEAERKQREAEEAARQEEEEQRRRLEEEEQRKQKEAEEAARQEERKRLEQEEKRKQAEAEQEKREAEEAARKQAEAASLAEEEKKREAKLKANREEAVRQAENAAREAVRAAEIAEEVRQQAETSVKETIHKQEEDLNIGGGSLENDAILPVVGGADLEEPTEPKKESVIPNEDVKESSDEPLKETPESETNEDVEQDKEMVSLEKMDSMKPPRHSMIVVTPPSGDSSKPKTHVFTVAADDSYHEESEISELSGIASASPTSSSDIAWETYLQKRDPSSSPRLKLGRRKSQQNRTPPVPSDPPPDLSENETDKAIKKRTPESSAASADDWDVFMKNRDPVSPRQPVGKRKSRRGDQAAMIPLTEDAAFSTSISPDEAWDALMSHRSDSTPQPKIKSKRKSQIQLEEVKESSSSKAETKDPATDAPSMSDNLSSDMVWDSFMNNRSPGTLPRVQSKRKSAILQDLEVKEFEATEVEPVSA